MNESIAEYCQHSPIPKKVFLLLNREGIIQDPLCENDLIGLQLLEKVWGKKEVLRPQLSRMRYRVRLSFLRTVDLASKWERYTYSRFRNQEPGTQLSLRQVIEEIQATYLFKLNKQQIKRVKALHNRARIARHRDIKRAESERQELLQNAI